MKTAQLFSLLIGLAALVGAALFARHHSRPGRRKGLSHARVNRIWYPAALIAFTGGLSALVQPHPDPLQVAIMGFVALVFAGVAALIVILPLDFAVQWLRPMRDRRWLIAAPILFCVGFFAILLVPLTFAFGEDPAILLGWDSLAFAGETAAAGLIWWTYLPPNRAQIGGVFE